MPDHLLIYVIVFLNAFTQAMLIWRFKLAPAIKWKLCCSTVAVPLILAVIMRLLIAQGILPARIADQSFIEQLITKGASMMLIAGPWMVTIAVIIIRLKERASLKKSVSM